MNLVCRDEKLRDQVLADLRLAFRSVCSYKLDEDVNEILYCRNDDQFTLKKWNVSLEAASRNLNDRARELLKKQTGSTAVVDELVEVQDFLNSLKL